MAAIGIAWADGAWDVGAWAVDAWQATASLTYTTGAAQTFALSDLDVFMTDGADYFTEIASDLDTWIDSNMGFAESVFSGATEMSGIFDDHSTAGDVLDGPRIVMKTSDIVDNTIDQGSVLTIRSRTFHVAGVQRDGTGVSTVVLVEPS